MMEVSDNGDGVPEHARDKIFQPFFTTNAPGNGTGLGLSVSSRIMNDMGGSLAHKSTHGKGTCATMSLPLASQEVS